MTTTSVGRRAESVAAQYLEQLGYRILSQNYRTRTYEIDIIAERDSITYFVEVKYRKSDDYGSGLEYITPRKLRQMQFAAEVWLADHPQHDASRLSGIEVAGDNFAVTNFIESLTS